MATEIEPFVVNEVQAAQNPNLFRMLVLSYTPGEGELVVSRNGTPLVKDSDWQEYSNASFLVLIDLTLADNIEAAVTKADSGGGSEGGSSGFVVNEIVYGTIPSGVTGDILFVPAVEGSVIKLSFLVSEGPIETGITITCGAREVVSSANIDDGLANYQSLGASLVVGSSFGSGASNVLEITTLPGESLTITKDTGSTSNILYYTHQIGT